MVVYYMAKFYVWCAWEHDCIEMYEFEIDSLECMLCVDLVVVGKVKKNSLICEIS